MQPTGFASSSLASAVLHLLAIGTAVSAVVIVWTGLWRGSSWWWPWSYISYGYYGTYDGHCLMQPLDTSGSLCAYMSVVVGVSVVLSFISLIYLCTYVRPGPKRSTVGLELAACVFGLIWWIPAAVTATVYGRRADSDGLVEEPARTAVWALSWSSLGLFTLASLLSLLRWLEHRQRGRRPAVVQLQPPPHFTSSAGPPSYEYSPGGYPTPMQPAPGAPPLNGQTYGCPQSQQYPAAAEPPSYCPNYAR